MAPAYKLLLSMCAVVMYFGFGSEGLKEMSAVVCFGYSDQLDNTTSQTS